MNVGSTETASIRTLLDQLERDAKVIADSLEIARQAMNNGKRNEAVGTMLTVEKEIDQLKTLKDTVLILHRR